MFALPTSMYSMKRMAKPCSRENSTRGKISSSLTPRSTTAFNLIGLSPAALAAKMPSSTLFRSPRLVMRLNLSASKVSMLTLTRRKPARLSALNPFGEQRAIGGKTEIFKAVEGGKFFDQMIQILTHQRLAAGQADLFHAALDKQFG